MENKHFWCIHDNKGSNSNDSESICNVCKHICRNQSSLLKHRKTKHCEQIPNCYNFKDEECTYGKENCNDNTEKLYNAK